jgi:pyrroline-5-carboxylate reductase
LAPVAEALADGGVTCGLTAQEAKELVRGLFEGFAALLDDHPALIKERVMSPAGVTAAGYIAIERGAVRHAFMEALALAYQKTKKEES